MRAILCTLLFLAGAAAPMRLRGQDAHGRWFDLSSARGRTVVVTFASRKTEKDARLINGQLTQRPGILVVNVVDLRGVPHFAHKMAMKKIWESDRPGRLRHLVDERGRLAEAFGVDPRRRVDMFVVGRRGQLLGHYAGTQQLTDVEARLGGARAWR